MWCGLQLLAGSLLPREKGPLPTGCDLGQGQAARAGPRLCCVHGADSGQLGAVLRVQKPGRGEGECCGSGEGGEGPRGWACQRGVQPRCPQRSGCSAAEARWSSRTEAALPSAFTLGGRVVLPSGAPGTLRASMAGAACKPCRGRGLSLAVEIIYFY